MCVYVWRACAYSYSQFIRKYLHCVQFASMMHPLSDAVAQQRVSQHINRCSRFCFLLLFVYLAIFLQKSYSHVATHSFVYVMERSFCYYYTETVGQSDSGQSSNNKIKQIADKMQHATYGIKTTAYNS